MKSNITFTYDYSTDYAYFLDTKVEFIEQELMTGNLLKDYCILSIPPQNILLPTSHILHNTKITVHSDSPYMLRYKWLLVSL